MKRTPTSQSGFTLIEIMLASGVVAFALSMLFGSLISVSVMGEVTESKADASIALDGILEYTRSLDYEDMLEFVSPEIEGVGAKSVITLECFDAEGESIALPLTAAAGEELTIPALPNPLEIKATITWSDNTGHVYEAYTSTQIER
jgi:prepilin-type N-terminal cleavage/methylation domain-containing protein